MARVNIDTLGISELKWTGMGEFNSDDHYIYYVGRNPSEEMEQPSWSTKELEMQYSDAISKKTRMISVRLQGTPFNITVIQVYAPTSNAEETEVEWFYEELTPKKMSFSLQGTGMQKQEVKKHLE